MFWIIYCMTNLAGQAVALSSALSNQGFAKESVNLSFILLYDKASCNLKETVEISLLYFYILHYQNIWEYYCCCN